eukprot:3018161-Rhodomonas_salina.1
MPARSLERHSRRCAQDFAAAAAVRRRSGSGRHPCSARIAVRDSVASGTGSARARGQLTSWRGRDGRPRCLRARRAPSPRPCSTGGRSLRSRG